MTNESKKTNTTAVATVKTEKAPVKKAAAKVEKVMTMAQVKSAARAAGVTFVKCKNTATSYVIFDGRTSLHIKKSAYRMYATSADFDIIKYNVAHLPNTTLFENSNAVDKCRPHTVDIGSNADLKNILAAIAVNNHVELS